MNLDKNYAGLKPAMLNFPCTQDMHGVSRIKILRLSNTTKYNVTTLAQVAPPSSASSLSACIET